MPIQNIHSGDVIQLTDVYYVPDFRLRLLSVAALERAGCCITIQGGICTISFTNGDVLKAKRNEGQMYELLDWCIHKNVTCFSGEYKMENDIIHWHRRFGHISKLSIMKMFKDNLVRGLEMVVPSNQNDEICRSCQMGKSKREPFQKVI